MMNVVLHSHLNLRIVSTLNLRLQGIVDDTLAGSRNAPTIKSLSNTRGMVEMRVGKSRKVSLITAFRYRSVLTALSQASQYSHPRLSGIELA